MTTPTPIRWLALGALLLVLIVIAQQIAWEPALGSGPSLTRAALDATLAATALVLTWLLVGRRPR